MRALRAFVGTKICTLITNYTDGISAISKLFDQYGHRPDESGMLALAKTIPDLTWGNYPNHIQLEARVRHITTLLGGRLTELHTPGIEEALRKSLLDSPSPMFPAPSPRICWRTRTRSTPSTAFSTRSSA